MCGFIKKFKKLIKDQKQIIENLPIIEEQIQEEQEMENLIEINDVKDFNNYIPSLSTKNKIVIHGTAGGTAIGAINWMKGGAGQGVAVHFVIDENGKIHRLFNQDYWAYHAGGNFRALSKQSFGIQIVNWLNLTKDKHGGFRSWTNNVIEPDRVSITDQWRNYKYFHTISKQQHEALQQLLKYLCQKYDITKKLYRNYDGNLPVNDESFSGILLHSTFHDTKMDFQPSIIPNIRI